MISESDDGRRYEEIDLTEEDERILDQVIADEIKVQERRLAFYRPLMRTLVEKLKVIDAEAKPLQGGCPTGLWWYARHLCGEGPLPKNYKNEEKWSSRIKQLMVAEGTDAICEAPYPKPPERYCDLVFTVPGIGKIWLEVKGAWLHADSKGKKRNGSYSKHLFAAAKDLEKVATLDETAADHFGLLLVGFDTVDDEISLEDIFRAMSSANRGGWLEQYEDWNDRRPGGRVRVWLFLNEAHCVPDIFDEPNPGLKHEMPVEIWKRAKEEMRTAIAARAKLKGLITYSDLVSRVKTATMRPDSKALATMLGEISVEEDAAGRGMLTAIVVGAADMQPGTGFHDLAGSLGRDISDRTKCWIDEVNRVYKAWA